MTENAGNTIQPMEKLLESWKEIASYLGRDVSTVRRWEKFEGLPVRRHQHQERSSVYAYPSELEAWKAARQPGFDQAPLAMPWRRPLPALGLTAVLLLALVSVASGPLLTPPGAAASEQGEGMAVRRVWAGPGVDVHGAPSPDGRYLTFVDWDTGDLALRDLTTGKNRHLTNKGSWFESTEFAHDSIISPDSTQAAYAWFNADSFFDLRLIGLNGSRPRMLYRNQEVIYLQPAGWTPDGKHVLATFFLRDQTQQIGLVSVADGSLRVIKTLDWRDVYPLARLSPDGRFIVYEFPPKEGSPQHDLFLLASDGSREIPLVQHPANDFAPIWTSDGKSVLFVSDRMGSMDSWRIQVVNGKPQGSPELVKKDIGRIRPMDFTRDGSYYYGLETTLNDVYIATLNLATGKLLASPVRATERFVGANASPAWSPDGRYLAYVSQRGRTRYGVGSGVIVIRSVETGQERDLPSTVNPRRPFSALRWFPDGRSLLFRGRDTKGRRGFYQIDVQTGDVTPVVHIKSGELVRGAALSPDGKTLFYLKLKATRLLMRDLGTGDEKVLYRADGYTSNLALSPDGRQLAFTTHDKVTRSVLLMVMSAAGGEPRELLRLQDRVTSLAWTPDGLEILFGRRGGTSLQEQTVELWRISAEDGEPQKLGLAMEGLRELQFHPDGKRIAFSAGESKAEIWVLENFLPKTGTKAARLEDE